jgi:hypothetical protein
MYGNVSVEMCPAFRGATEEQSAGPDEEKAVGLWSWGPSLFQQESKAPFLTIIIIIVAWSTMQIHWLPFPW